MSIDIHTHAALIAKLGGAAKLAASDAVDATPVNVRAWRARNRIPPEYWPGIIAVADAEGIEVDAEWLMRTTPARARPGREEIAEALA
ncbi:carph-isopro domain-containing protein [Sphingomonas sp. 3-13AW]|uniref:carph-isopro domain-containing protein n=1 Tax=Sphingomonas sp. 3-13AW TaxID=3050450 RepID=UPI003BB6166F